MASELVEALRAQFGARLVETHISWVLLAGDDAWKIKRPVRLPFLDFRALESRRRMCEEELRLNRRLAPTLYLDVVPVTGDARAPRPGRCEETLPGRRPLAPPLSRAAGRTPGAPRAPRRGGGGPPIEYALHMRRFADGALLAERLAAGRLTAALIDRLALRIAAF